MDFSQFFHVLNPNAKNHSFVKRFFNQNPDYKFIWVDRKSHPTHLETIIDWAVTEKKDRLAIWGGDGSFSRAVQALYERKAFKKVSLCFVPSGTGNDFCRRFGYGSLKNWISYFQAGQSYDEYFDVGLLSTDSQKRIFINNAGFGRSKKALVKSRHNPLQDILDFQAHRLEVNWDNGQIEQFEICWAYLGIIFNSPYFNKGLFFDPHIHPQDGLISGFLVPPQNRFKLFLKFVKSRLGGSLQGTKDLRLDAKEIQIKSDKFLYPQVDGEMVTRSGTNQLHFSVLEKSLKIWIPHI